MTALADRLIRDLKKFRSPNVFNPWAQQDEGHDLSPQAPRWRTTHLRAYLRERRDTARFVLVAEALGYQGGHFSGMAMTSERLLLGHLAHKGLSPGHVLQEPFHRSSDADTPGVPPKGFTEPTCTVVWGTLLDEGVDPRHWVNWNAFAWHPHQPGNLLSNRPPTVRELLAGKPLLETFLGCFPEARVVALGNKSHELLTALGVPHDKVRHPSMGGTNDFRKGMRRLLRSAPP